MQVREAIEEYRYAILPHSPHTQRWYLEKLEVFATWCELEKLQLESIKSTHIRRFIETVKQRTNQHTGQPISSYTLHGYAQTVKVFLNWCSKEDGLEELVSEKLPKRIEMPRVDVKVIETFSQEQIQRLFAACEKEFTQELAMRDRAILSVLLDTGVRASELCGLTLENVFMSPQDAYIKVYGKGRKQREVGLGKQARTALHRYITRYRRADKEERHIFLSRRTGSALTPNGLDQIIYRLAEWGRVTGVRCSAHTARHTMAVSYLQAGGDVYKLSRLLGHTSVQVTENYLRAYKARDARKDGLSVLDALK